MAGVLLSAHPLKHVTCRCQTIWNSVVQIVPLMLIFSPQRRPRQMHMEAASESLHKTDCDAMCRGCCSMSRPNQPAVSRP